MAGEVFRFKGQVGCAWGGIRCKGTPGLRLVEAGATKGDAERARRKKPVDEARRGAGESRARPAALVIANDMAKAQAFATDDVGIKRVPWAENSHWPSSLPIG